MCLLCLNNCYRKASATRAASIWALPWDCQQSMVSVYWEVNTRWKLFFIQSLDVELNHCICTLYYLLHMTQNICLILIRPMLFDHSGEIRIRSEYKTEQVTFKQYQSAEWQCEGPYLTSSSKFHIQLSCCKETTLVKKTKVLLKWSWTCSKKVKSVSDLW